MNLASLVGDGHAKKRSVDFASGDTVKVHSRVTEGNKERIQVFEGVITERKHGGWPSHLHGPPHRAWRGRRALVPHPFAEASRRSKCCAAASCGARSSSISRIASAAKPPASKKRNSHGSDESSHPRHHHGHSAVARAVILGSGPPSSPNEKQRNVAKRVPRRVPHRGHRGALAHAVRRAHVLDPVGVDAADAQHPRRAAGQRDPVSGLSTAGRPDRRFRAAAAARHDRLHQAHHGCSPATISASTMATCIATAKLVEPYHARRAQRPDYELEIKDYDLGGRHPARPASRAGPSQSAWQAPDRVPNGYYLMLGDNRNDSDDGHLWGFLRRDHFVGHAFFVFWPPKHIGGLR